MTNKVQWDAIVIGSGFGGAMSALPLVHAGKRVLMIERGGWVGRGPANWERYGAGLATPHYTRDAGFRVDSRGHTSRSSAWNCVGGQSVFYGAASYRFHAKDFEHKADVVQDSGAEWPFRYADIEPFYSRCEELLGVAGEESGARQGPARNAPFPQPPAPLTPSASRIADAGTRLGLTPSRIPLAISYGSGDGRRKCVMCGTCDGFACAAESKNDLATGVIPDLIRLGMTLRTNTICTQLCVKRGRISDVHCVNRVTGARETFHAEVVLLAAGALATPHLLLASDLARLNPAGACVGSYLTRHRNVAILGLFAKRPNPTASFDKQVAFLDFYEQAGSIQQLTTASELVRAYLPPTLRHAGMMVTSHSLGLLAMVEDQPQATNTVSVSWKSTDRYGLPALRVRHSYSKRDEQLAATLVSQARAVLAEAGALFSIAHPISTFSHALGTVRMGKDPRTSPLDAFGMYRGIDNLHVVDGSALPRAAALNPSLTIAANALRIGSRVAEHLGSETLHTRHVRPYRKPLPTVSV